MSFIQEGWDDEEEEEEEEEEDAGLTFTTSSSINNLAKFAITSSETIPGLTTSFTVASDFTPRPACADAIKEEEEDEDEPEPNGTVTGSSIPPPFSNPPPIRRCSLPPADDDRRALIGDER